jgi:hypothetical protein
VSTTVRHLLWIALVCVVYEAQFLYELPNPFDEGWPLYAAKRLHEGGTLYADTFFVFPPGHLLAAWLGVAAAPPGLELTRVVYAGFNLALVLALYAFGRRLLPPHLAALVALLVAVATFRAHANQNIFGYRYLVWSVLALIAFARSQRAGDRRWLLVAGLAAGVATSFRLTPGFAVSVAIGLTTLALPGGPARWLRDWACYAAGVLAVLLPLIVWATAGGEVDLATLWREVVVRPVVMTDLQRLALPPLWSPDAQGRDAWTASFVALQFRLYPLLLAGYGAAFAGVLWRARRGGPRFLHAVQPLVLCSWLFAAVYFMRALGRPDESHLVSALPPMCLLGVHALAALAPRLREPRAGAVAGAAVFALWVGAWGSDRAFAPLLRDLSGRTASDETSWLERRAALRASQRAARERIERGDPEQRLLDLSARPLIYTTGEFSGPGYLDVVMPGTFLSQAEERGFVERLQADPPVGVFWPAQPFDEMTTRGPAATAPHLAAWARSIYGPPPTGAQP